MTNPYRIMDYHPPDSPELGVAPEFDERELAGGKPWRCTLAASCEGRLTGYWLDQESRDDWQTTVTCERETCGLDELKAPAPPAKTLILPARYVAEFDKCLTLVLAGEPLTEAQMSLIQLVKWQLEKR